MRKQITMISILVGSFFTIPAFANQADGTSGTNTARNGMTEQQGQMSHQGTQTQGSQQSSGQMGEVKEDQIWVDVNKDGKWSEDEWFEPTNVYHDAYENGNEQLKEMKKSQQGEAQKEEDDGFFD